jgi:hypothetical protein
MEANYTNQDWVYEKIYSTLLQAISSSDEVKTVLRELQEKNLIQNLDVINLILSLDEISQIAEDFSVPQEIAGQN